MKGCEQNEKEMVTKRRCYVGGSDNVYFGIGGEKSCAGSSRR